MAPAAALPSAGMASTAEVADIYLDLTLKRAGKVKGEAVAAGHKDDIAILGFSWGVGSPTDVSTGQATGRRVYRQLVLRKGLDASSTAMISAVAQNDEIRNAVLTVRKAGGGQADYFTITLGLARFTAYDLKVDTAGQPFEETAIAFQKVEIEYRPQSATGDLGASFTFNDDLSLTK